ncbi:hypothetical protein HUA76_28085 [Myxococcus sp. CA056]|uniref:hypothetical protein n=1 Tax=unclassified Myxococcus TaxID=2648731 RepID=UPI00157B16D2|nr:MULTISPECIES: hypothetical protein [unclassified Myxococcus]NTX14661.1 hypothetical protein [Myxococcus sp. CA056]NTX40436.1 hypothetical protein [Myxococcus sp. CA033]
MTDADKHVPAARGTNTLAQEWRRWVVENLLRGAEVDDLVSVLERSGVDSALARAAVHAEAEDPCYQGAARAVAMQRKLEGLLDLYGDLHRQSPGHTHVPRHDALTPEDFFERYYFQNLPVVARATVLADAGSKDTLGQLGALARVAEATSVSPGAFVVPASANVTSSLPVRAPQGLVLESAPVGLWWEEPGADVPLAPSRRNMLLGQVHGRRLLQLVPAYALHRVLGSASVPEGVPRMEVELSPGELLLLPVGWWFAHRSPEGGAAIVFESFAAPEPNVSWTPRPESREPTPPPRSRVD